MPKLLAAGAPERTPCKPDRRTGGYPGGLNCNFEIRTMKKTILERMGVTERLKAENLMEWVHRMNNIRQRVNEVVNTEMISYRNH
nr:TnpV protein [uncultured Acetatifactor sp.]